MFAWLNKSNIIKSAVKEDKAQDKFNFEKSLNDLETLVSESEHGSINLEEMVMKYEQGVKILGRCRNELEIAELKIKDASLSISNPAKLDA